MVTEVGTNAALKRLLENKTSQRRAAEATDVSKTRRPSTRPMHRPRKYYLFYSRCTRKFTSNRDASSDVRVLFFNVIDRLDRKIYQWNNWSILDDDFSYKSQHFYSRKWPIVIVEFRRKLISLSLSSSIRPEARSSNFHFRSKIRGKSLGGIDTAQLCPVLSKFRTMKMEKKKEGKKLKELSNAYFSTDALLHRPAFAMVLRLRTDQQLDLRRIHAESSNHRAIANTKHQLSIFFHYKTRKPVRKPTCLLRTHIL